MQMLRGRGRVVSTEKHKAKFWATTLEVAVAYLADLRLR